MSSEKAEGLITFGLENGANRSGINSLSGYMEVAQAGGMVTVNPLSNVCYSQSSRSDCATSTLVTNTSITGRATWPTIGIESKNYNLTLTPTQQGVLNLPQQAITGKRITSAPLSATAVVSGINLTGNMKVQAAGLINLNRDLAGTVNNLKVNVSIDEDLGYFHKANLNGTPASLSLQSADIRWPGTKSVAQQGWWLEFSNPIDIGDITPTKNVDIALGTIVETLGQVSDYLYDNPVNCGILLLNCLVGSTINVGNVNLTSSPPVSMGLQNLQLKNQDFAPNCYGGLKFC